MFVSVSCTDRRKSNSQSPVTLLSLGLIYSVLWGSPLIFVISLTVISSLSLRLQNCVEFSLLMLNLKGIP